MEIKRIVVGMLGTNCYLVENEGYVSVIDPGSDAESILSALEGKNVDKILLTHGHFDHFMAAGKIKEKTGAKIYISEKDAAKLSDYRLSLYDIMGVGERGFIKATADAFYGESIDICGEKFNVLETPGHSDGSVCLLNGNVLFSGDTLFRQSIGRYDRGSYDDLMHSLWELMLLEDDINVLPGHGEITTIGLERKENPFLR